ncbi:MAG: hypothetical protein H7Y07_13190 [Pyrinomonadaceae bacterium]|nr:hypothetical protein [Sphingobacteriaceae bacterium]
MKLNIILSVVLLFFLISCKKSDDTYQVRYEFSSDVSDEYKFVYAEGNGNLATETKAGNSWVSKSFSMKKNKDGWAVPTILRLEVYPPVSWQSISKQANVKLKIIINGEERVSSTKVLTSTGVFEIISL